MTQTKRRVSPCRHKCKTAPSLVTVLLTHHSLTNKLLSEYDEYDPPSKQPADSHSLLHTYFYTPTITRMLTCSYARTVQVPTSPAHSLSSSLHLNPLHRHKSTHKHLLLHSSLSPCFSFSRTHTSSQSPLTHILLHCSFSPPPLHSSCLTSHTLTS
jgi:hypothetical protein